jgi:sigma-B regulation protein RsbU (phosphoserine phosphatase)
VSDILDRLELQVDFLQESFNVLSRARTLEDLAKKFFHILRGNLLIVDASIFYRSQSQESWKPLFVKNTTSEKFISILNSFNGFKIECINHSEFDVYINYPLIDKARFGILLGHKLDKSGFSDLDKIMLQFFLQQLDSAYQFYISRKKEKQLIFSLNHRVLQLNSLFDSGVEIAKLQQDNTLMQLALERVLALTNASKGMLRIKQGRQVVEKIYFPSPFKSKTIEHSRFTISTEFRFLKRKYSFYLFDKESRDGRIVFDSTDQLLLDAFARQVNVSLENHYLYEESLEKQRIDNEVSIAGTIQQKLIPEQLPAINGYDLAGRNIPTKYVGGDYYDCFPLSDGRYALIMADVSGKGIPAALLVSTLHASMHAYMDNSFVLADLVQKLNLVVYNASTIDKYITAFFALLDPSTGEMETVCAGHNPPYILRKNNTLVKFSPGGIPLGMMGLPFPYESEKHILEPRDRVLFYTDGVTEAMNEKEEEYDDVVSLEKFLQNNSHVTAQQLIDDLFEDIDRFAGSMPQSDDITALYLIRKE